VLKEFSSQRAALIQAARRAEVSILYGHRRMQACVY